MPILQRIREFGLLAVRFRDSIPKKWLVVELVINQPFLTRVPLA